MKIGVSSQNFKTISGHAGKARRFIIYRADQEDGIQELKRLDLPKHMSMHEFSGDQHPLDELDVLITGGCGEGFIRRMQAKQIQVITTNANDPRLAVRDFLAEQTYRG